MRLFERFEGAIGASCRGQAIVSKCRGSFLAFSWILLAACGGGGGNGGIPPAPAPNTGAAVVGVAGGTVTTGDGVATAVFPANAFASDTPVTVGPSASAPASLRLVTGTAFDFGPSGSFAHPVQLTIKYDPANLPAGALESHLAMYTATAGVWQPVPGSTVDPSTHTVTAQVSHFSTYGAVANSQFAGSYSGTYTGALRGAWSASVDAAGAILATSDGGFATGTVDFNGTSTIPLVGSGAVQGITVTFAGKFSLQANGVDVTAAGTWTSNTGQGGNWTGSKVAAVTPSVYVIDSTDTLIAFDANGFTLAAVQLPSPVSNINGGGITADTRNVYVTIGQALSGYPHGSVVAYDKVTLAPVTLAATAFGQVDVPRGIVFDPHNSRFYVGNGGSTVTAYDSSGNYLSSFSGGSIYGPSGIAFDSTHDTIWVANFTGGAGLNPVFGVADFLEGGSVAQSISAASQFLAPAGPTRELPYSIGYCPSALAGGNEFVAVGYLADNSGQGGVAEGGVYTPAGVLVAAFSPQLAGAAQPNAISCGPNATIYVAANDGLHLFSTSGKAVALAPNAFLGLQAPIYGVFAPSAVAQAVAACPSPPYSTPTYCGTLSAMGDLPPSYTGSFYFALPATTPGSLVQCSITMTTAASPPISTTLPCTGSVNATGGLAMSTSGNLTGLSLTGTINTVNGTTSGSLFSGAFGSSGALLMGTFTGTKQ